MRIRKKPGPPSPPPPPFPTRFHRPLLHLLPLEKKMGYLCSSSSNSSSSSSRVTSGGAPPPQGLLQFDRRFSVVQENRRIGWPCFPLNHPPCSHCDLELITTTREMDQGSNPSHHNIYDKGSCIPTDHPTPLLEVLQGGDEGKDADQKKRSPPTASYGRNENSSGASITAVLALPLCSSQVERWCEAEKIVPLKKRKGRYQGRVEENMIKEKERDMKVKVKAEPSKKRHEEDDVYEEDANRRRRRRKRGNVLMEGSRCSRVNGRGWRCKQMTLVGYALCPHHLGKVKIKSMSSIGSWDLVDTSPKIVDMNNNNQFGSSLSNYLHKHQIKQDLEKEDGEGKEKKKRGRKKKVIRDQLI